MVHGSIGRSSCNASHSFRGDNTSQPLYFPKIFRCDMTLDTFSSFQHFNHFQHRQPHTIALCQTNLIVVLLSQDIYQLQERRSISPDTIPNGLQTLIVRPENLSSFANHLNFRHHHKFTFERCLREAAAIFEATASYEKLTLISQH